MQPRQKRILKTIVKEYCRSGEPVGSLVLAEKWNLEYSPATIRGEMARLERKGFLRQPHTSAGRVPTDTGIRFFINELMDKSILIERERQILLEYVNRFICEQNQLLRGAARALARVSRNLGFGILPNNEAFYGSGYGELLRSIEEENYNEAASVFGILESGIEKKLMRTFRGLNGSTRVFVGDENPVREFRNYSLVVGCGPLDEEREIFVGILGPKKMNYSKNICFVNEMANWFSKRSQTRLKSKNKLKK